MGRAARNKVTGLTDKEEAFCQYIVCHDECSDSDAYRHAYDCSRMQPKTINQKACQLKKKDHIAARLDFLRAERSKRTNIDADYVLQKLHAWIELDVIDIIDEEGNFRPVHQWPKQWRTAISAVEARKIYEAGDDDEKIATIIQKIKWPDRIRSMEMLGKHISVAAFEEKVQVTHKTLAERMSKARQRANDRSE